MTRQELSETQWERLLPLLPPQKPKTGRPAKDHRTVVEGILFLHRTGCPWRDLPERFGPWKTVSSRFYRWREAGVWDRVLTTLQEAGDADGTLDWEMHAIDSTTIRAHHHAAGAKRGTQRPKPLDAAVVGSPPSCMCVSRVVASPSSSS